MSEELRGKREEGVMVDEVAFTEDAPSAQDKPAVRIRCCICAHEDKGRCAKKKVKVAVNKPRRCELFEMEMDKIPVKRKLPSTYVPFHMRSKDAYKKHIADRTKQVEAQKKEQVSALTSPDCLSKFRSTAGDK